MYANERERLESFLQEIYDRVGVTVISASTNNE